MRQASRPAALLTAVVLTLVSLACVVSCFAAPAAMPMPPCHQHHAQSCSPLLLTAETPSAMLAHAVPATITVPLPQLTSEAAPAEAPVYDFLASFSPPLALRI